MSISSDEFDSPIKLKTSKETTQLATEAEVEKSKITKEIVKNNEK